MWITSLSYCSLTKACIGQESDKLLDWLSPLEFSPQQQNVFSKREPGTGLWFVDSRDYQEWRDGESRILWCEGARKATL